MMSHVSSDEHVAGLSKIVVDVIKTILYIRGQFPIPLEQLKNIANNLENKASGNTYICDDIPFYYDQEEIKEAPKPAASKILYQTKSKKRHLQDAVASIDEYFVDLQKMLQNSNVLELVLSLGGNFMIPTEIYHIKLPTKCTSDVCNLTVLSLKQYRRQVLQNLFKHPLIQKHMPPEKLMSISMMLLLSPGSELSGNMEYKRCYNVPKLSKQVVLPFNRSCSHGSADGEDASPSMVNSDSSATNCSSDISPKLWVKLKQEIKGLSNKALDV